MIVTAEMAVTGSLPGRVTVRTVTGVLCVLLLCALGARPTRGLVFRESPRNVTVAVGADWTLTCLLESLGHPPIRWLREGHNLPEGALGAHFSMQDYAVPSGGRQQLKSSLKITSVQRALVGRYQCVAGEPGEEVLSDEGWLMVEGLPSFTQEPREMSVMPGEPFNLTCVAVGPPEPVAIAWYRDGNDRLDAGDEASPAVLLVPEGITSTTTYSCHASNRKGTSVSRPTRVNVKVLPIRPLAVSVSATTAHSVRLSWTPGFDGHSPIRSCLVQFAKEVDGDDDGDAGFRNISSSEVAVVASSSSTSSPQSLTLSGLAAITGYGLRVACANEVGLSAWSDWIYCNTSEGVPSAAPTGLSMELDKDTLTFHWDALDPELTNGVLLGYRLLCWYNDKQLVNLEPGRRTNVELNISTVLGGGGNYTARVLAYTAAGEGPRGPATYLSLPRTEATREPARPPSWTAIVVACVASALLLLVVFIFFVLRRRRQDTFFGNAFGPNQDSEEPLVHYQVKKSYSKRSMKATLQRLGISEELNTKLKDVMLDRRLLSLGKVLGEGEFGSVIEGKLKKQGDTEVKVAVKTMKMDICSRGDMDNFLSEAVRMMEFDHPNVIRLLGVCMSVDEQQRLPRPMVVLPFMRHGDLHSYLLRSRVGETPVYVPMQMLVRFMVDVARGMEYLSSRQFIHRDLAARNCMLHEDMTVCVADFGLSKKIYSGDYYRQGQISKMPVKWIAIESMADRLYTSKSDVWAFGVTMWEIVTWGKMPYPGIQNHEMYEYLLAGNRLKQPASCLNELYAIMWSCWLTESTERPPFSSLRVQLEALLRGLPQLGAKEDVLYANMEPAEASGSDAGGAWGGPAGWHGCATLPLVSDASDKPACGPRIATVAVGGGGGAANGSAGGASAPRPDPGARGIPAAPPTAAGKLPADEGDVCDGAAARLPAASAPGAQQTVVAAMVHSAGGDGCDGGERAAACCPAAPPPLDLDRYTEPVFAKGEAPAGGGGGGSGSGSEAAKPRVPSRGTSVEEDDYSTLAPENPERARTGDEAEKGGAAGAQQR